MQHCRPNWTEQESEDYRLISNEVMHTGVKPFKATSKHSELCSFKQQKGLFSPGCSFLSKPYIELYCHLAGSRCTARPADVHYCGGADVGGLRWASLVVNSALTRV